MVARKSEESSAEWLRRTIADFVATSPLNTLGLPGGEFPVSHTSPRPTRANLKHHLTPQKNLSGVTFFLYQRQKKHHNYWSSHFKI